MPTRRGGIRGVPNNGGVVFLFWRRVGRDARRRSHPAAGACQWQMSGASMGPRPWCWGGGGGGQLLRWGLVSQQGAQPPRQLNKPFILSEGLPPVPYKLTARILKGEFVDMAELLHDNLEAQRRAASMDQSPPVSAATPLGVLYSAPFFNKCIHK